MRVAGIDVSTRAIDLVLLEMDTDQAEWERCELKGDDVVYRVRQIREWLGPRAHWDEVLAVGIERPSGQHKGAMAALSMVFGAVLTRIPPLLLVKPWQPSEWRKACGLKGNATKEEVADWVLGSFAAGVPRPEPDWPQDALDATAIAYATRSVLVVGDETENAA